MTDRTLSLLEICRDECGAKCCKAPASPPIVFPEERERIITLGKGNFFQKVEGKDYFIIPQRDGRCAYLLSDNTCSIEESKPLECRLYPYQPARDGNGTVTETICGDCPAKDSLSGEYIIAAQRLLRNLPEKRKVEMAVHTEQ